jgi:hypothetical protein
MILPEYFAWPAVQNLALRIHEQLVVREFLIQDQNKLSIVVKGRLGLSHDDIATPTTAHCTFIVDREWLATPPQVICAENWVIKGQPDWHVSRGGTLCFELDVNWRDLVGQVSEESGLGVAAEFATGWCLNSARWLLYRHSLASQLGLKKWPRSWPYWSHGEMGRREYEKMKLAREQHKTVLQ